VRPTGGCSRILARFNRITPRVRDRLPKQVDLAFVSEVLRIPIRTRESSPWRAPSHSSDLSRPRSVLVDPGYLFRNPVCFLVDPTRCAAEVVDDSATERNQTKQVSRVSRDVMNDGLCHGVCALVLEGSGQSSEPWLKTQWRDGKLEKD